MKTGLSLAIGALTTSAFAVTGDPSVPQELTTTASHPMEVRPGLFDFGKAGVGWLEFHNAPKGGYGVRIGEMTNELDQVASLSHIPLATAITHGTRPSDAIRS